MCFCTFQTKFILLSWLENNFLNLSHSLKLYATMWIKFFLISKLMLPFSFLKHTPFSQNFVFSSVISSMSLCSLCNLGYPGPTDSEGKSLGGTANNKHGHRIIVILICPYHKNWVLPTVSTISQTYVSSHPCGLGCVSSTWLFPRHGWTVMFWCLCKMPSFPITWY